MRHSASAVIAALLFAGLAGGSALLRAAEKWVSVRSPNFLLVGNASEGRIRQLAIELERFRATFALLFPNAGQQSSTTTTVVVFKDDSSFRPFKPLYQGKPANVSGFFQSGPDVNYIALNGDIDTPAVIYHEFVHSLTRDATNRLPAWVSEGMAEFYSTFKNDGTGRNVELGRPVEHHVLLLRERTPIPLETFLAVDQKSTYYNEESKQGIFYAQSWALVHYLVTGKNGARRSQLAQYLSLVADGKPMDESFQSAFHTDYAGIEKELREYLSQFTMTFFKLPLPEKFAVEKNVQTDSISEAQAAAYRGDLLGHMGRADVAEKELKRAIELDPALARSYVSMGMLRLREQKDKEALEFLSSAVQRDSQNSMAHFYYANLLERLAASEGEESRRARLEVMRMHVKKAIEISPRFVEAYPMLAFVAVSLHAELDETEAALRQAIDFAPGREELRLLFANVMAVNNKAVAARTVATAVRSSTTTDEIRRQADRLLEVLRVQIESAQALRDYQTRQKTAAAPQASTNRTSADDRRVLEATPRAAAAQTPSPGDTSTPDTPPSTGNAAVRPTRRPMGLQVEGSLTLLECVTGMTLHVRTAGKVVRLHTDNASSVNFVSYVPTMKDSIVCGPAAKELHVVVFIGRRAIPPTLESL